MPNSSPSLNPPLPSPPKLSQSRSQTNLGNNQLLLLLEPLRNLKRDLQRLRHDPRRRQRQPLRQRDVNHAIAFVDFDPLQRLVRGRVLNVVARVIGEDGGVAGGEVEGAGGGLGFDGLAERGWVRGDGWMEGWMVKTYVSDESGCAGGAGEEVEPFFRLRWWSC